MSSHKKRQGEMTMRRMRRQVARLEGRGVRAMAVPGGLVLLRMLAGRLEGWAGEVAMGGPAAPVWRAGLDDAHERSDDVKAKEEPGAGFYEIIYEYRDGEMQAVYADRILPECVREREDGQPQVLVAGAWTNPPTGKVMRAASPNEALRMVREWAVPAGAAGAARRTG